MNSITTIKVRLTFLVWFILSVVAKGDLDLILSWSVKLFFVTYCSLIIWTYLRPLLPRKSHENNMEV